VKLAPNATKRTGEDILLISCQHLENTVIQLIVKNGNGILIIGGPNSAQGTINPDGSFRLKSTRNQMVVTKDSKFVNVENEYILSGSLAESNAYYTVNYIGFDAGCDYEVALSKAADSFKF